MSRNDVAIEKAESLGDTYKIKAVAYKVDGVALCICLEHLHLVLMDSLVSQAGQVSAGINRAVEDFGKIDVFVANAGML